MIFTRDFCQKFSKYRVLRSSMQQAVDCINAGVSTQSIGWFDSGGGNNIAAYPSMNSGHGSYVVVTNDKSNGTAL